MGLRLSLTVSYCRPLWNSTFHVYTAFLWTYVKGRGPIDYITVKARARKTYYISSARVFQDVCVHPLVKPLLTVDISFIFQLHLNISQWIVTASRIWESPNVKIYQDIVKLKDRYCYKPWRRTFDLVKNWRKNSIQWKKLPYFIFTSLHLGTNTQFYKNNRVKLNYVFLRTLPGTASFFMTLSGHLAWEDRRSLHYRDSQIGHFSALAVLVFSQPSSVGKEHELVIAYLCKRSDLMAKLLLSNLCIVCWLGYF